MLESEKAASRRVPVEELFISLGIVYVLSIASDRLMYESKFSGYDSFLGDIFKCKITDDNRVDYAYKLKNLVDGMLNKAVIGYQKSKKE